MQLQLPELGCACATVRRTARLVTQLYSREMGSNMEPTQYSLLVMLNHRPAASQGLIGRALGLDKTTMSRNLRLVKKNGWVAAVNAAGDGRSRRYELTAPGRKAMLEAKAGWSRAEAKLRAELEKGELAEMVNLFNRVAEAALQAQQEI